MATRSGKGGGKQSPPANLWLARQLHALAQYLSSYTASLRNRPTVERPYARIFVDGLDGPTYLDWRDASRGAKAARRLLFPDLARDETQLLLSGVADVAAEVTPRFDRHVALSRRGAAAGVLGICDEDWTVQRALLFLDPVAAQIEWPTIAAVARTRAIDLWLLVPMGLGLDRLLAGTTSTPEPWRRRVDALLGSESWLEDFHRTSHARTPLDDSDRAVKAAKKAIGRPLVERLKSTFAATADEARVVRDARGHPLYLVGFAVGSTGGARTALRLSSYLLAQWGA